MHYPCSSMFVAVIQYGENLPENWGCEVPQSKEYNSRLSILSNKTTQQNQSQRPNIDIRGDEVMKIMLTISTK